MLRDSDPRVREDAVEVLGAMLGYAAPALPDLELALKDRDSGVRRSAEVAVCNVKRNMNLPEFRKILMTRQDAASNGALPHQ